MTRSGKSLAPTTITHTAMLSAYEKCGEWRRAVSLLQQLREAGSPPETHYNVAMSACGKAGEWREAETLLALMREDGATPSSVTFSVLIAAYGRGDREDKANISFKEMLDAGLKPDDYTFVGLMLAPATRGDLATCMEIKRFMKNKHGVEPTVHVWNECVRAADACAAYETAVDIYQDMVKAGVEPNATTRELLTRVGKNGVEYYEDKRIAASFGTLVASLVGVAGMMAGRW
jgi:pentatricopeptide repeat protein